MDKYLKLDVIGKGCNGNSVALVKNLEDNKTYAMKRIFVDVKDEESNKKNMNEIAIFEGLKHPNIVCYFDSFIHKDKLCIIMEYADGGDLSNIIKLYSKEKRFIEEEKIWDWFFQIAEAIKYIHSKKILHRDIKSQNIFLTKKGEIKLGDFGISKILANTMDYAKTSLGTPYFLSPEICSGEKYNFKTDIWMIGCVIYELSCLKKPFEGENFTKLIQNILYCDILPIPKVYSENLQKLVSRLLNKDASQRPFIDEIFNYGFIKEKIKFLKFDNKNNDCCLNNSSSSSGRDNQSRTNTINSNSKNKNKFLNSNSMSSSYKGNQNLNDYSTCVSNFVQIKNNDNQMNNNNATSKNKNFPKVSEKNENMSNTNIYFLKKIQHELKNSRNNSKTNSSGTNSNSNSNSIQNMNINNFNLNHNNTNNQIYNLNDSKMKNHSQNDAVNQAVFNNNQINYLKSKFKENSKNKNGNKNNFNKDDKHIMKNNNINSLQESSNLISNTLSKNNQNLFASSMNNNSKRSNESQNFENSNGSNNLNMKNLQNKSNKLPAKLFPRDRNTPKIYSPSMGINDMNQILKQMNLNNEINNNQINLNSNNLNNHNVSINLNHNNLLQNEENVNFVNQFEKLNFSSLKKEHQMKNSETLSTFNKGNNINNLNGEENKIHNENPAMNLNINTNRISINKEKKNFNNYTCNNLNNQKKNNKKNSNNSNKTILLLNLNEENNVDEEELNHNLNLNFMNVPRNNVNNSNLMSSNNNINQFSLNQLNNYTEKENYNNINNLNNNNHNISNFNISKNQIQENQFSNSYRVKNLIVNHNQNSVDISEKVPNSQKNENIDCYYINDNIYNNINNGNYINVMDVKSPDNNLNQKKTYKLIHQNNLRNSKSNFSINNQNIPNNINNTRVNNQSVNVNINNAVNVRNSSKNVRKQSEKYNTNQIKSKSQNLWSNNEPFDSHMNPNEVMNNINSLEKSQNYYSNINPDSNRNFCFEDELNNDKISLNSNLINFNTTKKENNLMNVNTNNLDSYSIQAQKNNTKSLIIKSDYSPTQPIIEEKIKNMRQRTKSIQLDIPSKLSQFNQNTPSNCEVSTSNTISNKNQKSNQSKKKLNDLKVSNSNLRNQQIITIDQEIFSSTSSNKNCNNFNTSTHRDYTNEQKNILRKGHHRQISINISSIQSPDHKAIYNIEKIEKIDHLGNFINQPPENQENVQNYKKQDKPMVIPRGEMTQRNINKEQEINNMPINQKNTGNNLINNGVPVIIGKSKENNKILNDNSNSNIFSELNIEIESNQFKKEKEAIQQITNNNSGNLSNKALKSYEGRNLQKFLNKNKNDRNNSINNYSSNSNNCPDTTTNNNSSINNIVNLKSTSSNSNNSSNIFSNTNNTNSASTPNNNSNMKHHNLNLNLNHFNSNSNPNNIIQNNFSPFSIQNSCVNSRYSHNQLNQYKNFDNNINENFFNFPNDYINFSPVYSDMMQKNKYTGSTNINSNILTNCNSNVSQNNIYSNNSNLINNTPNTNTNLVFNRNSLWNKENQEDFNLVYKKPESNLNELNINTINLSTIKNLNNFELNSTPANVMGDSPILSNISNISNKSNNSHIFNFNSRSNTPNDVKNENMRSGFMLNFLHERYGENKFTSLINLIDSSDNPLETLKDDEKIRNIVGDDYKIAQKFLRIVFNSTSNTPVSVKMP